MAALSNNPNKWACVACTFLNDCSAVDCEMCHASKSQVNEKRAKIEGGSSSSSQRSLIGPAAFIAAVATLAPTSTAFNNVPLGYRHHPTSSSIPKRSPGAGADKIRLLTWNTDGIFDGGYCEERAREASALIIAESPDVILLQELVPESLQIFQASLEKAGYVSALPHEHPAPYFCGIFTSNCLTTVESSQTPFECGSFMYRDLIHIKIEGGPLSDSKVLHVYTSHLESLKAKHGVIGQRSQDFRLQQLLETTDLMLNHASRHNEGAVFAGDTNLRNDEVVSPRLATELNKKSPYEAAFRPKNSSAIVDAFEMAGEPNQHKFTWDCFLNDNLAIDFKPRARYDRCLMTRNLVSVVDGSFHLLGTSKFSVHPHGRHLFPSDHFGICVDLHIN